MKKISKRKLGPVEQKILLLLQAGLALSLTRRPDHYFKIIEGVAREWKKINQRSLHDAIKKLYQSQMTDCRENDDGTVTMVLSREGKKKTLQYSFDHMKIKKPAKWDGLWRLIIFDIPEYKKKARDALNRKMKLLGLQPLQKSVFVSPYDCRDEIDFICEIYDVKPFVRYVVAREIDAALHLKRKFDLL